VTIQDEKTSSTFTNDTAAAEVGIGELDKGGIMRRELLRNTAALGGLSLLNMPLTGNAGEQAANASAPASRIAFQKMLQTLGQIDREYLSAAWGVNSDADIAEGYRLMMHLLENKK